MRRIIGSIIKCNEIFKMIKNHDQIMVGISGGKDSTLLFYALSIYAKNLKEQKNWDVKVYGAHVKVNFWKPNYTKYLKWLKDHNLKIKIIDSNVSEVLNSKKKNDKVVCSLCSKMKKAILIREAKKLKCNKLAMGHHFDDAIETLFLNYIFEGRLATFLPNTYLDREKVYLIRPMVLCNEEDIVAVTKKLNVPIIVNKCPNDKTTKRAYIKNFLENNFYNNKEFPNAYLNLRNALLNGKQSQLWFSDPKKNLDLLKILKEGKSKK